MVTEEAFKDEYRLLGNRGLTAKFLLDEVDPLCDPLGPDNKLVLCTSVFAGTGLSTSYRVSFGAKSPLTGGIKESNVGGGLGYYLSQHGIRMMIFEDKPEDDRWHYVRVRADGNVELLPADDLRGLNNYALVEKLQEKHGKECGVATLGIAGERQYNVASIMVADHFTGKPTRAAGRGGLGAVMGSKQIKAIVVEKAAHRAGVVFADKERFETARKKFKNTVLSKDAVKGLSEGGTHGIMDMTAALNIMPVKNFSGEMVDQERFKAVSVDGFKAKIDENGGKTGQPCQPGCLVRCANIYNDSDGNFLTGGLEYETTVMFGPNIDVYDMDFLAKVDRMLDDLGIDTIEMGNAVAMCMEGGKIAWGDQEAVLALLREVEQGTEFGKTLAQGTEHVGKYLGVKRIPTVKKQSIPAYDPRTMKGQGVTYCLSAMGADHTTGNTVEAQGVDHADPAGKVELAAAIQTGTAVADNIGCIFCIPHGLEPDLLPELYAGLLGGDWNMDKVLGLGIQTLLWEKEFNRKAGFTAADNMLPEFLRVEKTVTGHVFNITPEELAKVEMF
jgi:aldehyde:ferredoxin oxidoreductase